MKYQLRKKNYNDEDPELALIKLLQDRGIENPGKWLHPCEDYEHSPLSMFDMKKGFSILDKVLKIKDSNILIIVDSDLDGYTSGAIIFNLLQMISFSQDINYILHPGKEHGIDLKDIPDGTDLVIVPDAGSSQKEEHLKLLANGIKLIILDHHEIENDLDYGEYQDDIAIISSQREYENPALSGAGVALKFALGYCRTHGIKVPMKWYSLAACGIIADVMDLGDLENKYIIDTGLKYMEEHPFLMSLIKDAHFNVENPTPTIKDIGWTIGPNINSIIRLGTMPQKRTIFKALVSPLTLTYSSKKGHEGEEIPIYDEAIRLCSNAKKRQSTAIDKNIKLIQRELEDDDHNSIIYIDEDQELTFELSGLIANKLLSQTNKPVILLKPFIDKNGEEQFRGSVRGKAAEGLDNLREVLKGITGVEDAQGHPFAFGLWVNREAFPSFKAHLNSILDTIDFNANLYVVDMVCRWSCVNREVAQIFARDDIWGHGVEKPLGVITDIPTTKYEIMGYDDQHIKIDCGNYDVVAFNVPELVNKIKTTPYNLNVIGEFDIDKSYNVGRLQFIVKDYELNEYIAPNIWDAIF